MSEKKQKVPKLRFPGFTGEWEQRKLCEVAEITMGQSPSSKNYTDNPEDFILVQGNADLKNGAVVPRLWTKEVTKTAEANSIILTVRAPVGEVAISGYDVVLGRGVAGIKGNDFLYYVLLCLKEFHYWEKLSSGSTFDSINSNDIKEILINMPDEKEQEVITSQLKNIDNLIILHLHKLENLKLKKKALLQKLFPKNGMQFPELRFPGFTDAWEQRKLIDYLKVSCDKNKDNKFGKADVLSVSGEYGIVNQIEFQGRSFAGVSVANYGVVEIGDVVYTKSPLKANPYGIIKTNKLTPGIVSTLYAVYKPLENIDSDFVQVYFEHDGRMNNYMKPLVNKGAKNDMKVTDENALKGDVIFPAKEEQEHIVKCFSTLDNLITLHQRKLEHLQLQKKALLQQMFV